ncbi:MAG TPA: hypothetical protein VIJ29_04550 [Candidatus Paceibacterota bacterium]
MRPRTIIIIATAVIVLICVGVGLYFYFANAGAGSSGIPAGSSATGGNEVTLPAVQVLSGTPTGTILTIGTPSGLVQMNNFYLSNPPVTDGGETVILASTTDYLITYDTIDSSFWIGIDPTQFDTVRPTAEQAFLSVLGVSSADACKLDVVVGVFWSATSSLSGQSFPLSFCGDLNSAQ